jgi:hypothetical protein
MTKIKLGLCNPPEPIYLYVKNGELSGEPYLWYNYEIDKEKTIPVQQRGLTGYISELRLTTKEFKGKENTKLDIVVNADEIYIIRSGVETNFAKTFLLAASLIQAFDKPLIIAATSGDKNVVFCRLYDAATKARLHKEWDAKADWTGIIKSIQSRLITYSVEPLASILTPEYAVNSTGYDRTLLNAEIESIIKRKNISMDAAKRVLFELFQVRSRQHLEDEQLAKFLDYLKLPAQGIIIP